MAWGCQSVSAGRAYEPLSFLVRPVWASASSVDFLFDTAWFATFTVGDVI